MAMAISPLFESRFIDPNSSARLVTFPTIMCLTLGQKLATRERKKTPAPPFSGDRRIFSVARRESPTCLFQQEEEIHDPVHRIVGSAALRGFDPVWLGKRQRPV